MPSRRDPLSVRYDPAATRVLLAAIRAHQRNPGEPRRARIWVGSPGRQFRHLDRGGRTANERAIVRAIYYQTWRLPINLGIVPTWSPDLEWSAIENHGGRYGRYLRVRLYRYGGAKRRQDVLRDRGQEGWRDDLDGTGSWRQGTRRSLPGARVDTGRRAV